MSFIPPPLSDLELEKGLAGRMSALMKESDASSEQFERSGFDISASSWTGAFYVFRAKHITV